MVTIDGTEISGVTIDGEDVQEITVDGDTVWTAGPDSVLYDFEGGSSDINEWSDNNTNTWESDSDLSFNGTYSARLNCEDDDKSVTIIPEDFDGGVEISSIEYYYYNFSSGQALSVFDTDGNRILQSGTNNPQWEWDVSGGSGGEFGSGTSEAWNRHKIDFDYSANEVTITAEDMTDNSTSSDTSSFNGEPVEMIGMGGASWQNMSNGNRWNVDDIDIQI